MNLLKVAKNVNTLIAVGGTVVTVCEGAYKVFKWYEKKHGSKKEKEPIVRPIIKGQ
jgi:hypothetical protein